MSTKIRPLVAGNWKMNGTGESLIELRAIAAGLSSDRGQNFDALICLPATLLSRAFETLDNETLSLGGEDCHFEDFGAHTGDIAAPMLKEAGASYVILGHSERRVGHKETNELVCAKAQAAWRAGLTAIICVGESLDQRDQRQTVEVISHQLQHSVPDGLTAQNTVIAYEPVWAIGTGKTPTADDIAMVHQSIRDLMKERFAYEGSCVKLLYGGSVKPQNAEALLNIPNVNGALVGGAALKAVDFLAICDAYKKI